MRILVVAQKADDQDVARLAEDAEVTVVTSYRDAAREIRTGDFHSVLCDDLLEGVLLSPLAIRRGVKQIGIRAAQVEKNCVSRADAGIHLALFSTHASWNRMWSYFCL